MCLKDTSTTTLAANSRGGSRSRLTLGSGFGAGRRGRRRRLGFCRQTGFAALRAGRIKAVSQCRLDAGFQDKTYTFSTGLFPVPVIAPLASTSLSLGEKERRTCSSCHGLLCLMLTNQFVKQLVWTATPSDAVPNVCR